MIKHLLLVVFVLGAVGYPAYMYFKPPEVELTPAHPLGTLEDLDKFMQRWDNYTKSRGEVSSELAYDFDEQFEGFTRHDYTWKHMRENGYPRSVSIVVDAAGNVQAVCAEFPSKTQEAREPEVRSGDLVWRLWKKHAGQEPRFVRMKGDEGIQHVARFAAGRIKGRWTKNYRVPTNSRSICDSVRIYRAEAE